MSVMVRYWAAARAASGVSHDELLVEGTLSLAEVLQRVLVVHPEPRMAQVLGMCSVLVGDQPVGARDHEQVQVPPGSVIEVLPPFAGG